MESEKEGKDTESTIEEQKYDEVPPTGYGEVPPTGFWNNKVKAIVFINIYCVFDTVDNINAKYALSRDVRFFDIAFSRVFFNFIAACIMVCVARKNPLKVPREHHWRLGLRSVLLTIGQTANVFSIQILPLSVLTIVQNTQAVWTTLLGFAINREPFHKIEIIGIGCCFCGVVLMALSSSEAKADDDVYVSDIPQAIGILIMTGVACNDALIAVMARTMAEVHFSQIMFWFSAIGLALVTAVMTLMSIISGKSPTIFHYPLWLQYKNLLLTGLFSASNLTCLTIAYQSDNSSTVSLLSYISLVYAVLADIFFFNHKFATLEIIGAVVITTFNLVSIVYKR